MIRLKSYNIHNKHEVLLTFVDKIRLIISITKKHILNNLYSRRITKQTSFLLILLYCIKNHTNYHLAGDKKLKGMYGLFRTVWPV